MGLARPEGRGERAKVDRESKSLGLPKPARTRLLVMCWLLSKKPPWFSRRTTVPVFSNMLEPEPEESGLSTRPRVDNKQPAVVGIIGRR